MKNRNKLVFAILIAISSITIQSCKKYEEGPQFSLRTRTERVSNNWKVENYTINGVDATSLVSGYTETFTKENKFSYSWGVFNGTGNWAFQNNDAEIKITGTDTQASRVLTILKLEEKSFWYKSVDGGVTSVMHLIPN